MKISVIVPVYNEEKIIHGTLENLSKHSPGEIIVVDGGSTDGTVPIASQWAKVIRSSKGRAHQMNIGARCAKGDVFLFLHADTRLPEYGLEKIMREISEGSEAGRFRMCFDDRSWLFKIYESYTRFHFFSYGDQGFFVTRNVFETLAGFNESVPFEDIDFYRRLRRLTKPVIIEDPVVTSARRFSNVGLVRQKIINLLLVGLYSFGADVRHLKNKLYQEIR